MLWFEMNDFHLNQSLGHNNTITTGGYDPNPDK